MRMIKRLLCAALASLLIFAGALAEEGGVDAAEQAAIEAQQRAEQEAREKAEREAREKAEREARERAEQEAREKAEQEAREKAEREAKEQAEREAREKAEREAREKAEREAKEQAEREAREKAEREAREKAEQEAREKAEREARESVAQEPAQNAQPAAKETAEASPVADSGNASANRPEESPESNPKGVSSGDSPAPSAASPETGAPEDAPAETLQVKPADAPEDAPVNVPEIKSETTSEEGPADAEKGAPSDAAEDQPGDIHEGAPENDLTTPPTDGPADAAENTSGAIPEEAEDALEDAPGTISEPESAMESEEVATDASVDTPTDVMAVEPTEPIEYAASSDAAFSAVPPTDAQAGRPEGETALPGQIMLPPELATELETVPAEIAITPEASKGVVVKDGVIQVMSREKAKLSFPWDYAGDCTGYKVCVVDAQGNVVYCGAQADSTFAIDLSEYKAGSYALIVEAVSGEAVVAWGQYTFSLASGGGFPGGFGGGFGGGFARRGGSGASDGMVEGEEEQGFQVTPGEALSGSHNSGTKDLQLYGTVSLTLTDEEMTELVLGGTSLGIFLDGGRERFTANIDGNRLTLAANSGEVWSFNGTALRVLSNSGVETLILNNGASVHDVDTGRPLAGDVYARLCAEGIVSSDYEYRISNAGTLVRVDGRTYRVDESDAMIPMEGDGYAETMADSGTGVA